MCPSCLEAAQASWPNAGAADESVGVPLVGLSFAACSPDTAAVVSETEKDGHYTDGALKRPRGDKLDKTDDIKTPAR